MIPPLTTLDAAPICLGPGPPPLASVASLDVDFKAQKYRSLTFTLYESWDIAVFEKDDEHTQGVQIPSTRKPLDRYTFAWTVRLDSEKTRGRISVFALVFGKSNAACSPYAPIEIIELRSGQVQTNAAPAEPN